MVKNKTGGNKSKNIGNKFSKKIIDIPQPDFENSFFAEIATKPNGLIANVKLLPIPSDLKQKLPYNFETDYMNNPVQVNIGKLKNDKRNSYLNTGDIVQIEINYDMKRKNGATYAYILCKYSSVEIRQFKKDGLILVDETKDEDDPFDVPENHSSKESLDKEPIPEIDLDDL